MLAGRAAQREDGTQPAVSIPRQWVHDSHRRQFLSIEATFLLIQQLVYSIVSNPSPRIVRDALIEIMNMMSSEAWSA